MLRNRKQIRLRNFDYASEGWYFVTICTQNREFYLGTIVNRQMCLSEIGKIAHQCWNEIPLHFPAAEIGEFVVMPNHIHGIIGIHHSKAVACNSPTPGTTGSDTVTVTKDELMASISPKSGSLSAIIRSYKSAVTNWCNKNKHYSFGWQSRFHDHIIRNQGEFDRIEKYIQENIENWDKDKFIN